jgi:hypothetical protein
MQIVFGPRCPASSTVAPRCSELLIGLLPMLAQLADATYRRRMALGTGLLDVVQGQ